MKTIIVATDFSENANNALDYAGALAANTNARIIVFNAIEDLSATTSAISAISVQELLRDNKEQLEELVKSTSVKFNIEVEKISKLTFVSNGLAELVTKEKADLVVMGMHKNKWRDGFFGNTVTAVIRVADFPVLIVPENCVFDGIKRILYAFNSNSLNSKNELALLKEFASIFNAEVQVFHVETTGSKHVAATSNGVKPSPTVEVALDNVAHIYTMAEEADIVSGIEKRINEYNANLIVMVPHKLSLLENVLHKSVTRKIALVTQVPLLVLPNKMELNSN